MQNRAYWAELRLKQQLGIAGLLSGLAILIWFSVGLVSLRMLHDEECNTVFGAHLLALGKGSICTQTPNLFQLVLAWILPASNRAIDIFVSGRYLMLEIFWINMLLLALATGERLLSLRGLVALCLAASLAPLWDYGMEIRPDNIVLLAVLLLWCSIRVSEPKPQIFLLAGALTAAMHFVTFKSLLYFVPVSLGLFLFPPSLWTVGRRRLAAWWTVGASAAFITIGIVYAFFGLWNGYVQTVLSVFKMPGARVDFEIWSIPGRLIAEVPLLFALVLVGCSAIVRLFRRQSFNSLTWSGCAPEAALMLLAMAVSLVHPAAFRYGLLFLVPCAFLFAWRYVSREVANVQLSAGTLLPVVTILVFAHVVPFGRAVQRLRDSRILRQERLMLVSETLSDKDKDWVFDGAGMLPTRAAVDPRIQVNGEKGLAAFQMYLATNPPVVIIPGIPKEKMPAELVKSISSKYVALSEDFWLLGQVLPEHGGTFEVLHAGRYHIGPIRGSRILGTYNSTAQELMHPVSDPPLIGMIDCEGLSGKPIFLSKGKHTISSGSKGEIAMIWLGPQSTELPMLADGQSQEVFFNW